MLSELPPKITRLIQKHHRGGVTPADCLACSSACCSHSGFAILENVQLIYELYQAGHLRREDFVFEFGLSFRDFVFKYFDVTCRVTGRWLWQKTLLTFYPRSITGDNRLIVVPRAGSYCYVRSDLFDENPWLNKGCVFLSKKVPNWPEDDGDASRYCLLHAPKSPTHLSAKPIDCVFYTCNTPIDSKIPSSKTSQRLFRALAKAYPRSVERFKRLIEEDEADSSTT